MGASAEMSPEGLGRPACVTESLGGLESPRELCLEP